MMQIVDQALARMRVMTYRRTLAELAMVRMCALEDLQEISAAIRAIAGGAAKPQAVGTSGAGVPVQAAIPVAPKTAAPSPSATLTEPTAPAKKNLAAEVDEAAVLAIRRADASTLAGEASLAGHAATLTASARPAAASVSTTEASIPTLITPQNVRQVWKQALAQIGDMAAAAAEQFREIAILAPNHLVVRFPARYKVSKDLCARPEPAGRIEAALARMTGGRVRVEFAVDDEPSVPQAAPAVVANRPSPRERLRQVATHPLVQRACEVFRGTPLRVEDE
jgi:DNA polymerase-3 subunit gamma/tau